jgi:RHS repeat-associated protein
VEAYNGVQVKDTKYSYDGLSFGNVTKGNQTTQENWKTSSSYVTSQKAYNAFGLVASSTDPRGKITTYGYDVVNLYPATTTNPLNQKIQYAYDYAFGKPKKVTDPNGLITQNTFDGLGRITQTQAPDLTTSSTQVVIESAVYTDTSGAVSVKNSKYISSTSTADSYSYYDGLGRLIQSRTAAPTSTIFEVKDLSYNDLGLLAKESLPYFSTGTSKTTATTTAALFTNYTYDPLQRLKTASNILGNATTTYSDWKTTITDPNGKTKDLTYDAYKRLVEVDEHDGASTYQTFYQYDGNGSLTKITDALGNVRNFTYDGLGRRLTAEDLHVVGDGTFGSWSYTYDDGGNLTSQFDPKSQTINYTYDDVNRPLTEDYTGQGGTEVTYTYDSCAYGVGSVCVASSTAIRIVNTYNPRRWLASETKTIDGTNFATSYTYDRQGNQLTITNPDSSQIKYEYAGDHFLKKVSKKETTDGSFVSIVNNFDYAPNEQVSSISFANGMAQNNTYDPAKLYRMTRKLSVLPNATKAQDLTYTYDAVGNITQLVEAGATNTRRTVNYGYDDLYRLTSASATSTPVGISGYSQTFSYDALGNILSSDQGTYSYAGNTGFLSANPDAATAIGPFGLTYDNNGNLTGTTSATSSQGWSVNGGFWNRRRTINIDHTKVSGTSTLVNFPVVISNTDADFKTTTYGGYVASSTGADIFFTSADGSSKLNHEIESYTSTTGALTAWVQLPTVPTSTDTLLYMYYGNASSTNQQNKAATWDTNTKGVWHFNNSLLDSTTNTNNGTNFGSTNLPSGKIADARSFTGVWDRMTVTRSVTLEPSTQITLSTWMNQSGSQPNYAKPLWYGQNIANPWGSYGFYVDANSDMATNFTLSSATTSFGTGPAMFTTSTWQYLVGTYDGAKLRVYLDGNLITSSTATFKIGNYNATSGFSFGTSWNQDADWNGSLDEVRVASTTRSSDWIKTEYNNQNSPSTFYTMGSPAGSGWYNTGGTWNYRKPVVVDHTKVSTVNQTTLTDFAVLVSVTDTNLKTTTNGGKVGKADGTDLVFTSSDGITKLSHEIESYTSTTGALTAWVRVPTLVPSTDTNLFLYFGNAASIDQQDKTATWDASTKGVWHFNNSLSDSTSYGNNGTNHGSTNLSSGKIGPARDFTGVWDTVTVTSTPTLQPSSQITLSTWMNRSGVEPDYVKPIWYGQNIANPWGSYGFYIDPNSDSAINLQVSSNSTGFGTGPGSIATSTWQYVVGTYDGSRLRLYIDGSLITSSTAAFQIGNYNATSGLSFGSSWNNDADWYGSIDETRVASTTRSADWIKTEYNNQVAATMLNFGALQASTTVVTTSGSSTVVNVLTWDYLNRLTQVTASGTTSTYAYDPSNERIKAVVVTSTTATTYYPTKFYNITAGVPTKHVFANGTVIATIVGTGASSAVSSVLTDHLTGASVVTNASAAITEVSDYLPYGAIRTDDKLAFNEQRKFAGHELDASTGLSYMDARYYNPSYGRFASEDPAFLDLSFNLSDPQSLNSYAYARNNPLIYIDPDGKAFWSALGSHVPNMIGAAGVGYGVGAVSRSNPYVAGAMVAISSAPMFASSYQSANELAQQWPSLSEVGASFQQLGNSWSSMTGDQKTTLLGDAVGFTATEAIGFAGAGLGAKSGGAAGEMITARGITEPYKRPPGATNQTLRDSVQGKSCATCGVTGVKMYADHKTPLVQEYYTTGKVDLNRMVDPKSVQPQCANCSNAQGGRLSNFSKLMKSKLGL